MNILWQRSNTYWGWEEHLKISLSQGQPVEDYILKKEFKEWRIFVSKILCIHRVCRQRWNVELEYFQQKPIPPMKFEHVLSRNNFVEMFFCYTSPTTGSTFGSCISDWKSIRAALCAVPPKPQNADGRFDKLRQNTVDSFVLFVSSEGYRMLTQFVLLNYGWVWNKYVFINLNY